LMRGAPDGGEEVAPRGVAISMRHEKSVNTSAERRVTDEIVELLENTWRLVVDDCAVVALCLVEIAKLLPNGCRTDGQVDVVRRRLVAEVKRHPRIWQMLEVLHLGRHV